MNDDNVTVRACRVDDNVIAVDLYLWRAGGTVDWLPSLHAGDIDLSVIEQQVRLLELALEAL